MQLTRRRLLQLSVGNLLAGQLWPGTLAAKDPPAGSFHFAVLNDLHYLDRRSGTWFEDRVLPSLRRAEGPPAFIILAGDLAENGTREQLGPVKDLFDGLRIPYHVVVGNHDYRTQTDRSVYDDLFPRQSNYSFEHQGWQFIGLDSSEGLRYQDTSIARATLGWLDDNLPRLNREKPTVVFTHFPLGSEVRYRPRNAEDLLNKFRDLNLRAVFSGHFHGTTERTVGRAVLTTNRCCAISRGNHDGSRQKGYFSCRAHEGQIHRTFVEVTN